MFGDRRRGSRIAEALREIDAARERAAESHASCAVRGPEGPASHTAADCPEPGDGGSAACGARGVAEALRRGLAPVGLGGPQRTQGLVGDKLPVSVSPRWFGTLLANRDDAAPTGDVGQGWRGIRAA